MIAYPNVKLNVGLWVLRRREDGYHDLDTLFVPYTGFHDTLEIITGDDYSRTSAYLQETYSPEQMAQGITPDGKLMVTLARKEGVDWDPLKDLTAKAYGLLAEQYKLPPMKIYLEKTSPVGAGLGGGSADAAFALRMIAELAGLALSDEELAGRRREEEARGRKAFTPPFRQRAVSRSLKAYAAMVSSADKGAVRIIED